uniref:Uncharacterized protein n=1 Tax=Mus musculus TaxID=10090 RepID=Q3U1R1_MOUSE|nr:unnamed protein product [Mus musculus]
MSESFWKRSKSLLGVLASMEKRNVIATASLPPFLTQGQPLPERAFAFVARSALSTRSGSCCGSRQQGTSRELRCDVCCRGDRHSYQLLRGQHRQWVQENPKNPLCL